MNQNSKTAVFVGVALSFVLLAYVVGGRDSAAELSAGVAPGKQLFPSFEAATQARTLTITDPKAETPLKLELVDSVWVLPESQGYPADSEDRVAKALSDVVHLRVEGIADDNPERHRDYGVIEPGSDAAKKDDTGVGKLVAVRGASGSTLAQLIIGNRDTGKKKSDSPDFDGGEQLRFVRRVGEDVVYRVKLAADRFPVKFGDWIQTNLLDVKSGDLKGVTLQDYSILETRDGYLLDRHATIALELDGGKWKPLSMKQFENNRARPDELADDEELKVSKLDDLRSALSDLKIVDVARKPAGLSDDLRADNANFASKEDSHRSLVDRGFVPAPEGGGMVIKSTKGEVVCQLKDGVEYVLHFGNVKDVTIEKGDKEKPAEGKDAVKAKNAADNDQADGKDNADADNADDADQADGTDEAKPKESKPAKVSENRYVMVSTRFNEALLTPPKLEPLPSEDEEATEPVKKDKAAKADDEPANDGDAKKPAEPDDANDEAAEPEAKEDQEYAADPAAKPDDEADKAKESKSDDDAKKDDAKKSEDAADDADDKNTPQPPKKPLKSRSDVERENKKEQERFDKEVEEGKARAITLNNRFADWYYVIPEKVYQKIHLTRADIVTKKMPPADEPDALKPKPKLELPPGFELPGLKK